MNYLDEKRTILRRRTDREPSYEFGALPALLVCLACWLVVLAIAFAPGNW